MFKSTSKAVSTGSGPRSVTSGAIKVPEGRRRSVELGTGAADAMRAVGMLAAPTPCNSPNNEIGEKLMKESTAQAAPLIPTQTS